MYAYLTEIHFRSNLRAVLVRLSPLEELKMFLPLTDENAAAWKRCFDQATCTLFPGKGVHYRLYLFPEPAERHSSLRELQVGWAGETECQSMLERMFGWYALEQAIRLAVHVVDGHVSSEQSADERTQQGRGAVFLRMRLPPSYYEDERILISVGCNLPSMSEAVALLAAQLMQREAGWRINAGEVERIVALSKNPLADKLLPTLQE